ncbi:hypothetical protein Uis1B_2222 [Bifidobacterium margollesii]|uniref:Uncharacterized protein n=1 Tax=Bifidobacterium margollesii TaxID=2020964 RepID=A0A2N5J6X5_9BIFI|nr:hypothetical protein [Bifidobacterium margollesii]PLS29954.1 hypothetical protein Uis1B_2222 [Bifidobacterium margollesii]
MTKNDHAHLHLIYLPISCRWCFTLTGNDIIPMLDQQTFDSPEDAGRWIKPLGLELRGRCVITVGPNPFGRD